MKRSAKVMSLAMALAMTSEMVPLASAQTAPPAQQQTQGQQSQAQQKQSNQQYNHPKARGAAGGAIIGGAMGNAGAGALIGAGHSRRQERRNNR